MRDLERIRLPLVGKRNLGAAMTALALVHNAPALAQATAEPAETVESAASDQIIVTGSRIARDGFQAPTPVVVLTQEDIQNTSPSNNIADFVNQLPQLAGSTKPANSRLNISNGSAGVNALNLRNLGENRVLILVDGRRSVGSTIYGWVDINTIPQALIDRVEVVTGGASSAYGSDAVSGVVNFILNKKMEGLRITGDIGITDKGDGFNYSGSVAGGTSFADGRGHAVFNAEIAHQDGIFEIDPNDRPWNHKGYLAIANPTYTATNGQPAFITFYENAGQTNQAPGGFITGSTGTTPNALRGLYFGQNGEVIPFQYGSFNSPALGGSAAVTRTVGGDWRVNDSGRRIGLAPKDDRYGFYGRLSFDVSDGVTLFAEGSFNKQEVFFNAGPNLGSATLNTTGCTTIPVPTTCNAFALQTLGAARLAGVTSVSITTTAADLPFRGINNKRQVQRYVVGAEGQFDAFGKSARWDIFGQYSRSDVREQLRNIMHVTRMTNATNAAFAPDGSIQCLINVDTDATNNDPSCVPLNRLGLGVADPAAIDYVLGDPFRKQVLEQYVAGANLSLTPFATWAGDVSVAIGAEYREEKIRGSVPTEFQPIATVDANGRPGFRNAWSVGNYLPFKGSYNVKEAYLETLVPLGFGLEFNGAVRATDYSTSGYVTTWKLGATWAPIEDIRFRVTRSRDIRAPNLNELFQAGTANSDSVRNPNFDANNPANGPQFFPYSGLTTGNLALQPEKADSWNIGGVITPRFLPGFSASVDYFRIDLKDAIDTISAQEVVNRCDEGIQQFCDAITTDPTRSTPTVPYLLIRTQPFNYVSRLVRGIDFDAAYRLPVGEASSITIKGTATRYIENLADTGIAGTTPVNTVGANGGQSSTPKWIFRANLNYTTPTFSGTLTGRGVSSGKYLANAIECTTGCPTSTSQNPTYDDNHVDGTFYVDLNLTQKVSVNSGSEAELFFNVTNLFDADPLLLPETGLAANSTYSDLLGRSFRIGVRFKMR
ncbi:TonB-dependent receptor domain-containing protein [Sphingopyxis kveilinensis]|uniref:TonB-dependent receptor domain-containing protein n=1 Tax=Sphingopyxis kveilinensis TaxID=3114367 RepID=UPI0030CD245C